MRKTRKKSASLEVTAHAVNRYRERWMADRKSGLTDPVLAAVLDCDAARREISVRMNSAKAFRTQLWGDREIRAFGEFHVLVSRGSVVTVYPKGEPVVGCKCPSCAVMRGELADESYGAADAL